MQSKREWILDLERALSERIPIHPNVISAFKIGVAALLLFLAVSKTVSIHLSQMGSIALFVLFAALDYLDGTVARHRNIKSRFGRVLDRLTDLPMLLVLFYTCRNFVPFGLIAAKVALDSILVVLYLLGKGESENRLRTATGAATMLVLLILGQGWAPRFITSETAVALLGINIAFTTVVALYYVGVLKKRYIADALSFSNLLCGVFSMVFASSGRCDMSLLFLLLGAAFDGFDGAAARKFGGTRFGVYSDDIADGVNYGIAPGVALYFALGGIEGVVLGVFYSVFTLSRLVFFTLNKAYSDPEFFCGVPSTVGGIVVLSSIVLFDASPSLLGLMVGIACVQMVSFDIHYRHLGRALASNRRIIYGIPGAVVFLIIGRFLLDSRFPFAAVLAASLVYGFLPTFTHFIRVMKRLRTDETAKTDERATEGGREETYERARTDDTANADDLDKKVPFVLTLLGKILGRLGLLALPFAAGVLVGFYFSDQGVSFLPSTLTIVLGIVIAGAICIPLGRILQGRAFQTDVREIRLKRRVIFFAALSGIAVLVRLVVYWMEAPSPLTTMPRAELDRAAAVDLVRFSEFRANMESAVRYIEGPAAAFLVAKKEVLTEEEQRRLLTAWQSFYDSATALDGIREFYEDWYRFDPSKKERAYHLRSFLLSQAAEVSLYKNSRKMVELIQSNPHAEKFLDASHTAEGWADGTFSLLKQELLGTRDEAAIVGGLNYLHWLEKALDGRREAAELGMSDLWDAVEADTNFLAKKMWLGTGTGAVRADIQAVKRPLKHTWLSAQGKAAEWMGDTRVRRIGEYLITRNQQETMDKELAPGDILLARKNWYLSNVALPGFWPHAILYLGAPGKLKTFFDTKEVTSYLKTLTGSDLSLPDYLKQKFPEAWQKYTQLQESAPNRVIEAVSEGVMFNPLHHVTGDYTAALRPALPKLAKAQAVIAAFSHFGKPYDFDFDFATEDKLVCTELVWRSYRSDEGKQGLELPLVDLMGRRTMPANEIAEYYAETRHTASPPLKFVYFLDASEEEHRAFVSTEEAFAASHLKAKWDIALP